jgi:hypothetical protein
MNHVHTDTEEERGKKGGAISDSALFFDNRISISFFKGYTYKSIVGTILRN